MTVSAPRYISASRRNDLPAFHNREFFEAWRRGEITYDAGWGRSYTVSLKPADVLGYIFWSKDFGHFIAQPDFKKLIAANNAVFHYTINHFPDLEPRMPPLDRRLSVLDELCGMVGPERVFWRFDPVVKYAAPDGLPVTTADVFFRLLPLVRSSGVTRCYFSFMSLYKKTANRTVKFLPFGDSEKAETAAVMLRAASQAGMQLYNCCNEEVLRLVPGIRMAHCVDDTILRETDRFGVHRALRAAPTREGCGCFESRDIGSYSPACAHGCVYCYANPLLKDV